MEAVKTRESYDIKLLLATLVLLFLGLAIVLDASFPRAQLSGNDPYFFFKRQAMWAGIAMVSLFIGMRVPYWSFKKLWFIGIAVSGVLLIAVLIPGIGIEVNGSRRWLGFGLMRFQPSEFAKIALVIFLARYAELWRGRITHLTKGFLPPVAVVFFIGALIAKEDLGTAITTIGAGLLMIFMMGARGKHMFGLVLTALAGGVGFLILEPYRIKRVIGWLDLIVHPLVRHDEVNYQPWQGLVALGSGGVRGHGIGQGVAKFMYLPAEHTDYIFATIGEEAGLIGALLLLALFGWLVVRGLTVAHRTRDWFGSLMAAGLTAMIGIQAVLNIAVVTCLVPCTGVPLPFISYGGSSLVFTTLALGIVLNISQYPNRVAAEAKARQAHESRPDGWGHRRAHLSGT